MRRVLRAEAGLVFAGLMSFVLMGAGQSLYGPALPVFARDFGIGTDTAGLLISTFWIGSAVGVAVMYRIGHRITPRHALAAMGAGAALMATGFGWWLTLLATVIFGSGYGASTVIYNRRFLDAFGSRGASMLALLNAIFAIGAISAPLIFVAIGRDTQLAYIGVTALAVVTFLGARVPPAAEAAARPTGPLTLRFPILLLGAGAIGIEASLIGLGPLALIALGVEESGAAEFLSLFFVAFLIARLILVILASALSPMPLFMAATGATALLAGLAAVTGSPWLFVPMGGTAALFFPNFYVTGVAQMGRDPRVGVALIAAGLVGGIGAPVIFGAAMGVAGDAALFPAIAALAAALTVATLILRRGMAR